MNLQGVAMVRNEADIIETFVRHNLTRLDGLFVIDHGSADETPAILRALVKEGLPLTLLANAQPGYAQLEITTIAVRHAFATTPADFVFPLDADEFIKTPSRLVMEQTLSAVPAGTHPVMTWHTYIPDFTAPYVNAAVSARAARRLPREWHGFRKVVVARPFLTAPRAVILGGNHRVLPFYGAMAEDREPDHILPKPQLALAHLPIRSAPQFVAKTVIKRLARLAVDRDWSDQYDRRVMYAHIMEGGALDAEYFRAAAVNLGVAAMRRLDPVAVELVDDPFLADFALRYTPAPPDNALPLVLAAVEQLASLEARARQPAAPAA